MVPFVSTKPFVTDFKRNVGNSQTESEIADILVSMGYAPQEADLIKSATDRTHNFIQNDEAYVLSKLSDDELLKLLSEQSNTKKINFPIDFLSPEYEVHNKQHRAPKEDDEIPTINGKKNDVLFRLENEVLQPQLQNNEEYKAWQKLNSLLRELPKQLKKDHSLEEGEKEILFDILVGQIKSLFFKKKSKSLKNPLMKPNQRDNDEYLFLVLSEDINENSKELVTWNPKILERNSSVLVLGPVTKSLPSNQLNNIMNHITLELSKPEYITLLKQLSKGLFKDKAIKDMIVLGHDDEESRRYMKPHRCNHRSQLARVYGGPKWILCTGYLNLNTPSLYD